MPSTGFSIKADNLGKILNAVQQITLNDVLVGFPDSGAARKDAGDPSNAYIAFIQDRGSPAQNIPSRQFMIPGINSIKDKAAKLLEQAAIKAMQGEPEKGIVILNQLGLIAVAAVQRAITVGAGWPPLSPVTLAMRRARGVQHTHPLIDSGQLRQHVEYVIRKRRSKYNAISGMEYLSSFKRL